MVLGEHGMHIFTPVLNYVIRRVTYPQRAIAIRKGKKTPSISPVHSRNGSPTATPNAKHKTWSNGLVLNGHANGHIPNGISNGHIPNGKIPNGYVKNGHLPNGCISNGKLQHEIPSTGDYRTL